MIREVKAEGKSRDGLLRDGSSAYKIRERIRKALWHKIAIKRQHRGAPQKNTEIVFSTSCALFACQVAIFSICSILVLGRGESPAVVLCAGFIVPRVCQQLFLIVPVHLTIIRERKNKKSEKFLLTVRNRSAIL